MLKLKKITPMFTGIITTTDKYVPNIDNTTLVDPTKDKTGIKEYQTILAIGTMVRTVKVGDLVCINPKRYEVVKQTKRNVSREVEGYAPEILGYNFKIENVNDEDVLMLQENDIDFIVDLSEEIPDVSPGPEIIQEEKKLILP